jgi:hypothetical protein
MLTYSADLLNFLLFHFLNSRGHQNCVNIRSAKWKGPDGVWPNGLVLPAGQAWCLVACGGECIRCLHSVWYWHPGGVHLTPRTLWCLLLSYMEDNEGLHSAAIQVTYTVLQLSAWAATRVLHSRAAVSDCHWYLHHELGWAAGPCSIWGERANTLSLFSRSDYFIYMSIYYCTRDKYITVGHQVGKYHWSN